MKRSGIFVIVFSLGVVVAFSIVGSGLIHSNQTNLVYYNEHLEYEIDFDYCKYNCDEKPYITIQISNDKIYFEQVYYTYCNADPSIFWLEYLGNTNTISILQIFEPNNLVARCLCPILITGVLGNFSNESFTLEFISVNNYVYQNHTLKSFTINM